MNNTTIEIISIAIISFANITIAALGAVAGVLQAKKSDKKLDDFALQHIRQHSADDVRIKLLWSVYIEDALEDARDRKLVIKNSPLQITDKGKAHIPAALMLDVDAAISKHTHSALDPSDLATLVLADVFDKIPSENRSPLVGAIYVKAMRSLALPEPE